jgi:hypothetical protein
MKANSRPPIGLVLAFVALALVLVFSNTPVSQAQGAAVPVAQSTRQPPGPGRPDPGPSRPQPTGPTAPAPTPGPGGPDTTVTPPVLPPTGGASAANFNWLLAGLGLTLAGIGLCVIQRSRQRS